MLTLEFLIEAICGHKPDGETPVAGITTDASRAGQGSLYVALAGSDTSAAATAFQRGAIAVITDRDDIGCASTLDLRGTGIEIHRLDVFEKPLCIRVESVVTALQEAARRWLQRFPDVRVIGVTGSVGKSTTADLIAQVLGLRFTVLKSEGRIDSAINVPLTVLRLTEKHQRLVLELGIPQQGSIASLASIAPPHIGVLTLIAPAHLERAGSMENLVKANAELVEVLSPDGIAILNADDENVMAMASQTHARIITYGLDRHALFQATDVEGLGLEGIRFWMHNSGTTRQMHLPMLGQHSVHTALRAAAVARAEGLSWEEIVQGLQSQRSQLRLLAVEGPQSSVILDDTYEATPSSTIAALNLLNDIMDGQRIAVLGDMLELGSHQEIGHELVGIRAAAVCDLLLTVGERARIIAKEAISSGMPRSNVRTVDTPDEALPLLLEVIKPGDSILVKGAQSAIMEQIVARLSEAASGKEGNT